LKIVLALILIITPLFAFTAEEAFFRPQSRTKIEIKEGDSFNGVIELWNIKNVSSEMISAIKGTTFIEHFYVVGLEKPKWSENNPEVVLIEGIFILQKEIKANDKIWNLGGLKIPIKIKEIGTRPTLGEKKKLLILKGDYQFDDEDNRIFWYVGIALLLLIFLITMLKNKAKKNGKLQEETPIDWKARLKKASTRDDFLVLYLNRKYWMPGKIADESEFNKLCSDYLFKKEVQDYELEQLSMVRDNITKVVD
jgi:hypothetical protein